MGTPVKTVRTDAEKRAALARLVRSTSEMVRNAFAPGGCVRARFLAEIASLPDAEAAIRAYAVTLGPRISEAVHDEMRDTFARARAAAAALEAKGRRPKLAAPPAVVRFVTEASSVALTEESLFSRARNVFFGGLFGCSVGHFLGLALVKCGWTSAVPIVPFACAFLGLLGGYLDLRRRSCHGYKARLAAHVNAVLSDLQTKYFTPRRVGALSEIDRCLAVLCGTAPDRLPADWRRKVSETKAAGIPRETGTAQVADAKDSLRSGVTLVRQGVASLTAWGWGRLRRVCGRMGNGLVRMPGAEKMRQIVAVLRS